MATAQQMMNKKLGIRKDENTLRSLSNISRLVDFSSNDYLGLAQSEDLKLKIQLELERYPVAALGSTGSRLLTGNSEYAEELEKEIAVLHGAENGLIFNSGYAANTGLFSSIPQKGDLILMDEYIHASVIDGARLSFAQRLKFKHNDVPDLEAKLEKSQGTCYVAIESVYSMDGDLAPLKEIAEVCQKYGAHLLVDEAHAFGVFGKGLVEEFNLYDQVFATVITFGKALGLHGAIVLGNDLLRDYLINFARPFIYSTAMPFSQLLSIKIAYKHLMQYPDLTALLTEKSKLFSKNMGFQNNKGAIQCVFVDGNQQAINLSKSLKQAGFDVRPIMSPTVPKGTERLRICLHTFNTDEEIIRLCKQIHNYGFSVNSINL